MSRLLVKLFSKVQNFLWNYGTANLAIFRGKEMLGVYCFINTGSSFNQGIQSSDQLVPC